MLGFFFSHSSIQKEISSDVFLQSPSQLIVLVNKCFECGKDHTTPRNLQYHLSSHHNYDFPKYNPRHRHFNNEKYTYIKTSTRHEAISKHCSCPCYPEHFESMHPECLPSKQQLKRPTRRNT
jgi:hypothetical protein